jgi:acetoin utilization deacetylase AcuC-like enzyme
MFLYDSKLRSNLSDYGIEIPIKYEKVEKTVEYIKKHPIVGEKFNRFFRDEITSVITKDDLLRVHSKEYVESLYSDNVDKEIIKSYELIDGNGKYNRYNPKKAIRPLKEMFHRELLISAGTYECCQKSLEKGFFFFLGGGSHHAKADYGEGFCIINDLVVAIKKLQAEKKINTAWIIDVDAHKGDGTSALTLGDDSIRTLSIHMKNGWPLNAPKYIDGKLNPSFIPSDIDINISEGEEKLYNIRLEKGLCGLASKGIPDIALVVLGADPYEEDELPSSSLINLSFEQIEERDLLIYQFLKSIKIPQAYVMAGGYGIECWKVYSRFLVHVLMDL